MKSVIYPHPHRSHVGSRQARGRSAVFAAFLCLGLVQFLASCGKQSDEPPAGSTTNATTSATPAPPPATNVAVTTTNAASVATSTNIAATNPAVGGPAGAQVAGAVAPPGTPQAANVAGQVSGAPAPGGPPPPGGAAAGSNAVPDTATSTATASTNLIQVGFQGAQVDMIVQWLAETTGKTVIKHPRVQCQLTIVSSRKVTQREAVDLVYHALSLEGFNAVETANSILILPEGQDVKMSPAVVDGQTSVIPEGRQRLVKIFTLEHVSPSQVRDKIKPVLSEKATVDLDERSSKLIVTDFTENLRLLNELIKELDVTSTGDSVIEVIRLKHGEAEEIANLAGMILNSQAQATARRSGSSPAGGGGPGGPPMSMPGGPPPGGPAPAASSGGGAGGGQDVRIWTDKSSNRLIVSTPQSRLDEVKNLIEVLDAEKAADMTVRTIPLKHVQAADLVREVGPLYQKMSGGSSKERVEIAANERSNSLIVLSSAANFENVRQLVNSLDTDEAQEKVVRTFTLRNADAQDVAKQLQDLNQDQDSSRRYPYYIFSMSSQSGPSKKMSVVADRRRNALVIQAPPSQMDGIARMIQELDEPVSDENLAPRIFQLKYVSAVDIEDVLNELFVKKQQNRPYWYYYDDYPQESDDRDVGRLYGKLKIISEPYSNTIIVTSNSKENLAVVEEILKQLDVPSQAGETTFRVPLRFAKSSILANNLNILFAKNGSPPLRQTAQQPQQNQAQPQNQQQSSGPRDSSFELAQEEDEDSYYPWLGGQPDNPRGLDGRTTARQVSDLVGRVRIVADERSNALLVSANVHLLPQIMKLIEELDAPTAQVLIEARIIEVSTDALDKLGVRWSPDGSKVFSTDDYDNSILGSGSARYTKGFGGLTDVNNPGLGNIASTLSQLRSGVLDATVNLDVLIQFLRKNTSATVLAEPQINVSDNEMGRLFVGQQVPFITDSQATDVGGLRQSFDYKAVGVILEVTPHINNSGDVALRIRAEASAVQQGQTLFGGAILDTRNFRTDVTAKSGETLVLGGIIQKQISDTIRKVPVLGDIPGLGWAFKKKDKSVHDVELMVFLRPKITRTPEEARALLEEIDTRAPLLKRWKEGPIHPSADTSTEARPADNSGGPDSGTSKEPESKRKRRGPL